MVATLGANHTRCSDSLHHFLLDLFLEYVGLHLLKFGLDYCRQNLEEHLVSVGEARSELGVALFARQELNVQTQLSICAKDRVGHEFCLADSPHGVFNLFELWVRHLRISLSDHVDIFAVQETLLNEKLEVDQLFALEEPRCHHENGDGSARYDYLGLFDNNGAELGELAARRNIHHDSLETFEALKVAC